MFKVSFEELLKRSRGQYRLLMMAFQRTHQLNNGMLPTVKSKSKKNVTIALQEIADGKVRLEENGSQETESDE